MAAKKKGETPPPMTMKAVLFEIPEEFRTRLRDAAWRSRMTVKGYIVAALEEAMRKEDKAKKN